MLRRSVAPSLPSWPFQKRNKGQRLSSCSSCVLMCHSPTRQLLPCLQVVHRQLIAALTVSSANGILPVVAAGSSPPASVMQSGEGGVMRHAELAEVAAHVNVMHRQAKRAQKDCSDLYLLLLLHKCDAATLTIERLHAGLCRPRHGHQLA